MKKTNNKKANASPSNNSKLPNINQKGKSPTEKSKSPKSAKPDQTKGKADTTKGKASTSKGKTNEKQNNNTNNIKTTTNEENKEAMAKKMEELKERKKKRLEKEKKEEERDKKVYEQIVKEFQDNKIKPSTEKNVIKRLTNTKKKNDSEIDINSLNSIQLPQIKISEKKTQAILEESGMLDAYKYLIIQLCKNGFPTGNLFEYSAYVIKNYEKKWKEKNANIKSY